MNTPRDDYTPQWIKDWCDLPEHDGGWFFPMPLTETHPLVVENWLCDKCGKRFCSEDGGVAAIMPFHSRRVWLAYHRDCILEMLDIKSEAEDGKT